MRFGLATMDSGQFEFGDRWMELWIVAVEEQPGDEQGGSDDRMQVVDGRPAPGGDAQLEEGSLWGRGKRNRAGDGHREDDRILREARQDRDEDGVLLQRRPLHGDHADCCEVRSVSHALNQDNEGLLYCL